jgi:hypothetical protein
MVLHVHITEKKQAKYVKRILIENGDNTFIVSDDTVVLIK